MQLETDRLIIRELNENDVPHLSAIARNMALKNSLDLINDSDTSNENKKAVFDKYNLKLGKYLDSPQQNPADEDLFCTFSMISPPFDKSAAAFYEKSQQRRNEENRQSFWMGIQIKGEESPLQGVIMITTKGAKDEVSSKKIIGQGGVFIAPQYQSLGYVSEAKAAMFDFTYKELLSQQKLLPEDTIYKTECHPLNTASIKLQNRFGAKLRSYDIQASGHPRWQFFSSHEDIYKSSAMQKQKNQGLSWSATMDDKRCITSTLGLENPLQEVTEPEKQQEVSSSHTLAKQIKNLRCSPANPPKPVKQTEIKKDMYNQNNHGKEL